MLNMKFLTNFNEIKNKNKRINVYSFVASLLISISMAIAAWFMWISKSDYNAIFSGLTVIAIVFVSTTVLIVLLKFMLSFLLNIKLIKKIKKVNSINFYYAYNAGNYLEYDKLREVVSELPSDYITYDPELEKKYNSKFYIKKITIKFSLWKGSVTKIRIMSKKGTTYLVDWNYAKIKKTNSTMLYFKYRLDPDENFKNGDSDKSDVTGEIAFLFDNKDILGRTLYVDNYRKKSEYIFGDMFIVRKSELRYLKDVNAKAKEEKRIRQKEINKVISHGEPTLDNINTGDLSIDIADGKDTINMDDLTNDLFGEDTKIKQDISDELIDFEL